MFLVHKTMFGPRPPASEVVRVAFPGRRVSWSPDNTDHWPSTLSGSTTYIGIIILNRFAGVSMFLQMTPKKVPLINRMFFFLS